MSDKGRSRFDKYKERLELFVYAMAMQETGEPYLYLYMAAVREMNLVKGYCSPEQLGGLFEHEYNVVCRYLNALERRRWIVQKKGWVFMTDKGRKELDTISSRRALVYDKIISNKKNNEHNSIKKEKDENNS